MFYYLGKGTNKCAYYKTKSLNFCFLFRLYIIYYFLYYKKKVPF